VSTLLHALYTFLHNLLNVLVQIANKMGLQKIYYYIVERFRRPRTYLLNRCLAMNGGLY
jgi:hypothetical protein